MERHGANVESQIVIVNQLWLFDTGVFGQLLGHFGVINGN